MKRGEIVIEEDNVCLLPVRACYVMFMLSRRCKPAPTALRMQLFQLLIFPPHNIIFTCLVLLVVAVPFGVSYMTNQYNRLLVHPLPPFP